MTGLVFVPAFAHISVDVEQYEIEVGWDVEPPVVGFRNAVVFEISESLSKGVKSGIENAFKNLVSTIKFGGISKILDIDSDPKRGHYSSKIIPTKTGSFSIDINGEINGVLVDINIPVEDVEGTAVLDFPIRGSSSDQGLTPLTNAMSSLQKDVSEIKSKLGNLDTYSGNIDGETTYNFAVFSASIGAAAVILAIIAIVKRKTSSTR
jgi:hypothetical protein